MQIKVNKSPKIIIPINTKIPCEELSRFLNNPERFLGCDAINSLVSMSKKTNKVRFFLTRNPDQKHYELKEIFVDDVRNAINIILIDYEVLLKYLLEKRQKSKRRIWEEKQRSKNGIGGE